MDKALVSVQDWIKLQSNNRTINDFVKIHYLKNPSQLERQNVYYIYYFLTTFKDDSDVMSIFRSYNYAIDYIFSKKYGSLKSYQSEKNGTKILEEIIFKIMSDIYLSSDYKFKILLYTILFNLLRVNMWFLKDDLSFVDGILYAIKSNIDDASGCNKNEWLDVLLLYNNIISNVGNVGKNTRKKREEIFQTPKRLKTEEVSYNMETESQRVVPFYRTKTETEEMDVDEETYF